MLLHKKAMTLLELVIVLVIMSGVIVFISASLIFFVNQTQANLERNNIYAEINYALEDMKMRCVSAVELKPMFLVNAALTASDGKDTKSELIFQGEADIYKVTPDNTLDNVWYKYYLANPDTLGRQDLVLMTCSDSTCSSNLSGSQPEILIDKVFRPGASFIYEKDSPPNLLKVILTAQSSKIPLGATKEVIKEGGIRFWFIDIAQ